VGSANQLTAGRPPPHPRPVGPCRQLLSHSGAPAIAILLLGAVPPVEEEAVEVRAHGAGCGGGPSRGQLVRAPHAVLGASEKPGPGAGGHRPTLAPPVTWNP